MNTEMQTATTTQIEDLFRLTPSERGIIAVMQTETDNILMNWLQQNVTTQAEAATTIENYVATKIYAADGFVFQLAAIALEDVSFASIAAHYWRWLRKP